MAEEDQKEEVKVKRKSKAKPKAEPVKKNTYTIVNRVKIDGVWKEKGDKIKLTEQGRVYLKSIHKIK